MSDRLLRIVSLIITSVVICNACVYGPLLSLLLDRHRSEQQMLATEENVNASVELRIPGTTVESSNGSFEWLEEDEFSWKGKTYDIIHAELVGDVWLFTALQDSEEDNLRDELAQHSDADNATNTLLKKNLKFNCEFFECFSVELNNQSSCTTLCIVPSNAPTSSGADVQDPPPWLS